MGDLKGLPEEVTIGFHVCCGASPSYPVQKLGDICLPADLSNAIQAASGSNVDYFHLLAMVDTDESYFAPRSRLNAGKATDRLLDYFVLPNLPGHGLFIRGFHRLCRLLFVVRSGLRFSRSGWWQVARGSTATINSSAEGMVIGRFNVARRILSSGKRCSNIGNRSQQNQRIIPGRHETPPFPEPGRLFIHGIDHQGPASDQARRLNATLKGMFHQACADSLP